jgi:hypothetical protein
MSGDQYGASPNPLSAIALAAGLDAQRMNWLAIPWICLIVSVPLRRQRRMMRLD